MRDGKLIKVCGMTDAENIRAVEALGVDMMGFIFYPKSPRCVSQRLAYLPQNAARVGVFVNVPLEEVLIQDIRYRFSMVQLHGSESPEYCRAMKEAGLRVIKAFSISDGSELKAVKAYEGLCEMYVFDTKCSEVGGSGRSFDWSVLCAYDGQTPFLLSGGIGPGTEAKLKCFSHPRLAGYDLNSRFESAPGMKDAAAIETFLNNLEQ